MKWDGMRRKENNLHWQNQVQMICIGMHGRETNAIWKCLAIKKNCTVSTTNLLVECSLTLRENAGKKKTNAEEEKAINLIKFSSHRIDRKWRCFLLNVSTFRISNDKKGIK